MFLYELTSYRNKLFEMPLKQLKVDINNDDPFLLLKKDIAKINNKDWITQVYNAFSKTEFNFNILLLDNNKLRTILTKMYKTTSYTDKIFDMLFNMLNDMKMTGQLYNNKSLLKLFDTIGVKGFTNKSDTINFIVLGNIYPTFDNARIPLTPWMLAHHIAHGLLANAQLKSLLVTDINEHLLVNFRSASKHYRTIIKIAINFIHYTYNDSEKRDLEDNIIDYLAVRYGTFKSVRTKNLNAQEGIVEFLTQYIINGKVVLKKFSVEDHNYNENLNNTLVEVENFLNSKFSTALTKCLGNTLVVY